MADDIVYSTVTAAALLGNAVATLRAEVYPRRLHSLTVTGPTGSRLEVYLGAITAGSRIDQTARGESNSADYSTPRPVPPGTPLLVSWPGQSARAASCTATFGVSRRRGGG
jgi:hypothetical protein